MTFHRIAASVFAAFALAACGQGGDTAQPATPALTEAPTSTGAETAAAVIDEATLRTRIETLSSDAFEGRAPGTPGGLKTRAYLVEQMQAIGLEPGAGDSFEQKVPLVELTVDPAQSYLRIDGADLEYGPEAVFWTKQVKPSVEFADSGLVFVGYGVVAPEYQWNDYEGLDVRGKTVVILINDPGFASADSSLFNGRSMTYYGRWTYKYEEAARQGAAGAIIVHQTEPAAYGWGVVEGSWTGPQLDLERSDGGAGRVALEGWIQESVARDLFAKAGLQFDAATVAAGRRGFKPVPLGELSASARIVSNVRRSESANVAGILRGAERPDEYVLYMAHWDHLGVNAAAGPGEDAISNGAVDNATGTAAILSIADAFAKRPTPPARSVIFLAVTAEESGLLGSAYFGESPLVPLAQIAGGINLDGMLPMPPSRDMIVIGYGASELEGLLDRVAAANGRYLRPDAEPEKGYFYRSDHISLAKKGVPMLYADSGIDLVNGGEAAGRAFADDYTANRYHKPADEYDPSWDMSGIIDTLNILFETGEALANSPQWPNWNDGNEFRAIRDAQRPPVN